MRKQRESVQRRIKGLSSCFQSCTSAGWKDRLERRRIGNDVPPRLDMVAVSVRLGTRAVGLSDEVLTAQEDGESRGSVGQSRSSDLRFLSLA